MTHLDVTMFIAATLFVSISARRIVQLHELHE